MRAFCVVYKIYGIYYRYRCYAKNAREAKKMCCECMGVGKTDIEEVYVEE